MAHIQKKIYMAVSDEEYLKKMQEIVYTEKAKDIFSLIYNYKVELETDKKTEELEKVKELEEAKLIKQENQGKSKAYKIYVVDIYSKDMEKLHIGNEKSTNKVVEFLPSNNINKKYYLSGLKDGIKLQEELK